MRHYLIGPQGPPGPPGQPGMIITGSGDTLDYAELAQRVMAYIQSKGHIPAYLGSMSKSVLG